MFERCLVLILLLVQIRRFFCFIFFQSVSFVFVAFEVYVVDVCAFERGALDFNRKLLLFPFSLRVSAPHNGCHAATISFVVI